jgi:hypothetical protein
VRRALVAVATALLLSACGGGDDDDDAADDFTEEEAGDAVDAAVLEADDLGRGWDDADPPEDDPFGRCFEGVPSPLATSGPRAFLRDGEGPVAVSRVLLGTIATEDDAVVDALLARLGEESFPACLADAFQRAAGETELGFEVGEADVDDDYLGLDGVRSGRVRIPFTAAVPGFELEAQLDVVLVSRGPLITTMVTSALGERIDGEDIARWAALLADRMRIDD